MASKIDIFGRCPHCNADWRDGKFSRVLGVYDVRRDRTVAWKCPDCGREFDRGQQ